MSVPRQLCFVVLGLALAYLPADVLGGGATFIERDIGERKVKLVLTGTATRTKGIFRVYNVASYLEQGDKARTAAELTASDSAKLLQLSFVRSVSGPDMANAFVSVFRANYPAPKFEEEVRTVSGWLRSHTVPSGAQVTFMHVPEVGFECRLAGKTYQVKNVEFSKAVWDNYLGRVNVGDNVKRGLTSRLPIQ